MALYDASWGMPLTGPWKFGTFVNAVIRALPHHGGHLPTTQAYLNTFFDMHVLNRNFKVCVTLNCQDPWPPMLDGIYDAAGSNVDEAAKFVGCMYALIAIHRPEIWICAPLPIFRNRADPHKWAPRVYSLWGNAPVNMPRIPRALI